MDLELLIICSRNTFCKSSVHLR